MYVDVFELYADVARQLEARYVCITRASNDLTGRSRAVRHFDEHCTCNIHPRSEYLNALAANRLVPIAVTDLTPQTIRYWEQRERSSPATGIEAPFLEAYREGSFQYLLIAADRV